jgi:hypothetical protein
MKQILLSLAFLCTVFTALHGATFTVSNTMNSGAGSLRQAIDDANNTAGADVIVFSSTLANQTITVSSPFLLITSDMTIDGSGAANLTISGGNASRIFWIQNGTITLQDLTLSKGNAKGGSGAGGGMGAGGAIFMHEGKQDPTTITSVTSNLNPSFTGNNVTFTATVSSGGNPVTLGTVTFTAGATTLAANVPINSSGQASVSTSTLAEGSRTITATYSGATGFNPSSGSIVQVVNNTTTINGNTFCNTGTITFNDGGTGGFDGTASTPYPSNIFVSGLAGTIQSITVDLKGVVHDKSRDIDLLLVAPTGEKFLMMTGVGAGINDGLGPSPNFTRIPSNLTLSDAAGSALPRSSVISSGTYRPTSYESWPNTFPAPAPAGPYTQAAPVGTATFASVFNGLNPNGTWQLYATDDTIDVTGSIANGWCLNFVVSPSVNLSVSPNSGTEAGQTSITVTATASAAVTGNQTVSLGVSGAGITSGDYNLSNTTITIPNGSTTGSVTFTVVDDVLVELTETAILTISNPSSGITLGATTTQNITITNDDQATLSINSVSNNEGNSGITPYTFTVTSDKAVDVPFTVNVGTMDGTATTADGDYVTNSATLNFVGTAGETQTFMLIVNRDTKVEPTETFTVPLSTVSAGGRNVVISGPSGTGTGTITNDDSATISINDVSLVEGNAGTTNFVFNVTLSEVVSTAVTVNFTTANGTAGAGDYNTNSGTVTFPANGTGQTQTITVQVLGDVVGEASETFFVNLTSIQGNPPNIAFDDAQGLGTILDDDLSFSINDVTFFEGNAGSTIFTFTVTRTSTSTVETIQYTTADNTATDGDNDYEITSGTLNFAIGDNSETITVTVNGDNKVEANETFFVNLSNVSNGSIADAQGLGTITNDDLATITLSGSIAQNEGNSSTTSYTFTATLDKAVDGGLSVPYTTDNFSATTADNDYQDNDGTLTFAGTANESKTITVLVNGDTKVEGNETFFVSLGTITGTLASSVSTSATPQFGSITNDDAATISIDNVTMMEGDAGTVNFVFNVTLSKVVSTAVTVDFATAGVSATSGVDFNPNSNSITFPANGAGQTQTITVQVIGDMLGEANETFNVNLSNIVGSASVTFADAQGLGTILDDDLAFSINDVSIAEGNTGTTNLTFTVTRTSTATVETIQYATADNTATTADIDYTSTSGTLNFAIGDDTETFTVVVNGDLKVEANESFFVNLSNASNGNLSDAQGEGTITNDDVAVVTLTGGVAQDEGNAGTTVYIFTATLNNPVQGGFTVPYTTGGGTATAGVDYVDNDGMLTFVGNANEVQTWTVNVNGDVVVELNETFEGTLGVVAGAPTGVTTAGSPQTSTITNDDAAQVNIQANVSQAENVTPQTFTITLSNPVDATVTVDFSTTAGTATATSDYTTITNQSVSFSAGSTTSQIVDVSIANENIVEADETYMVSIANLQATGRNVTLGANASRTGTITNEDAAVVTLSGGVMKDEGNTANTTFTFTVTLDNPVQGGLVANYSTNDQTATIANNDYIDNDGTLNFTGTASESQNFSVTVVADNAVEGNETFQTFINSLTLPVNVNPSSVTIAGSPQTATILNDEVDFGDAPDSYATLLASNGARHKTVFGFYLGAVIDGEVDGLPSANADGEGADDEGVTLPNPLVTSTTANVVVNASLAGFIDGWVDFNNDGDFSDPGEQVFTSTAVVAGNNNLSFGVPNGATPALTFARFRLSSTGSLSFTGLASYGEVEDYQVQIVNTQYSINDSIVTEGNSGTTNLGFVITRSNNASASSVDYTITGGTAQSGTDYQVLATGTANFTAGGALTETINVVVNGDLVVELNETVIATLSNPVNGTIIDATGTGTINNDDDAILSVSNPSVIEGGPINTVTLTFDLTLNNPSDASVVVNYTTLDGTATTANNDYQSNNGTHTFAPNETSKQVIVVVNGDCDIEATEAMTLRLSNLQNNGRNISLSGSGATTDGTGTITNDDFSPSFTVTGGGARCTTDSDGLPVGLNGSATGVNYQLQLNGNNVGTPVGGTGNPITFGKQLAVGTYSVVATIVSTSCTQTMLGSVMVSSFTCEPSISDPCVCQNNAQVAQNSTNSNTGTFSDKVTIKGAVGQTWTVAVVGGLFENAIGTDPVDVGDVFTQVSPGVYELSGYHIDALGYTISASNGAGTTLQIGNKCFYPDPVFTGLPALVAPSAAPFVVTGTVANNAAGTGTFILDGYSQAGASSSPTKLTINPGSLTPGQHVLQYSFDAGTPTSNNPLDPGCVQKVQQTFQVANCGCQDVTVSLDANCQFVLTGDLVSDANCNGGTVRVMDNNPSNGGLIDCAGVWTYGLFDAFGNIICWGKVTAEDKTGPAIVCTDWYKGTLDCYDVSYVLNNPKTIGDLDHVNSPRPAANSSQTINNAEGITGFGNCSLDPQLLVDDNINNLGYTYFADNCRDCGCRTTIKWSDKVVFFDCEQMKTNGGIYAKIYREWVATDCKGNRKDTVQVIPFVRPPLSDFVFNLKDTDFSDKYDRIVTYTSCTPDKSLIKYEDVTPSHSSYFRNTDNNRLLYIDQVECNYSVTIKDTEFPICNGKGVKIEREMQVFDWCAGGIVKTFHILIKIGDFTPPKLEYAQHAPFVISTGPMDCTAAFPVTVAGIKTAFGVSITDNCTVANATVTVKTKDRYVKGILIKEGTWDKVEYPIMNGVMIGVPVGTHRMIIDAFDGCYNAKRDSFTFEVKDKIAPVMKCDDQLNISLSNGNGYTTGYAQATAEEINEGSWDNCKLAWIAVRRNVPAGCEASFIAKGYDTNGNGKLDPLPADGDWKKADGVDRNGDGDLADFGETFILKGGKLMTPLQDKVEFFCCDLTALVTVELWGADTADNPNTDAAETNYNFCWMELAIEDKVAPTCQAPWDLTVDCDEKCLEKIDDKKASVACFGDVSIPSGNDCAPMDTIYTTEKKLRCGAGYIDRIWTLTKQTAKGPITITCKQRVHVRAIHEYNIVFPKDASFDCKTPIVDTVLTDELACDVLAVNVSDKRYDASDNECYKIFRTYTVINWCVYDDRCGDPLSDGNVFVVNRATFSNYGKAPIYVLVRDENRNLNEEFYLSKDSIPNNADDERFFPAKCTATDEYYHSFMYTQIIKVYDDTRPVVTGIRDTFCTSPTACTANITKVVRIKDNCTDKVELERQSLMIAPNQTLDASKMITFNSTGWSAKDLGKGQFEIKVSNLPEGTHDLIVVGRDECGNLSVPTRIPFVVKDCKAPAPICINGLSVNLMPDGNGGGMMTVWATDFVASKIYDCNGQDASKGDPSGRPLITKYSVNRVKEPVVPTQTSISVNCADLELGFILVELHAWDEVGNHDFCVTFVEVQDNNKVCPGSVTSPVSIAGTISTEGSANLQGASITLSGAASQTATTSTNGGYAFVNLTKGGDFTVTPQLDKNHLNGVSTFDLVLIQKHILGIQALNSPYKLIAADVNNSKSISTLDMIQLRKLILNIDQTFQNNTSWRFVDAAYVFPERGNPWSANFPEVVSVNDFATSVTANFVAIKVGDVNASASVSSATSAEVRTNGAFKLNTLEQNLKVGNEYQVAFSAEELQSIQGYQFALNLDQSKVELLDIEYGIAKAENFGIFKNEGLITTSWNSKYEPGVLFTLVLRAKADAKLSSTLSLNRLVSAEAYNQNNENLGIALNYGLETSADRYELYQNTPNPFNNETSIGFYLPKATNAVLTIRDVKGALIYQLKGSYAKGQSKVVLTQEQLRTPGVLYYTLETKDFVATKKMVILE